jgi:hypothetical protein
LLKKILHIKDVISVEIEVNTNIVYYHAIKYSLSDNSFQTIIENQTDLESFITQLSKYKIPIVITIQGDTVISKITNIDKFDDVKQFIKKQIPGINIDKIIYSIYKNGNVNCLSIIKKERYNKICENFFKSKLLIADIFIGQGSFIHIKNILSNNQEQILVNKHRLFYKNNKLSNIAFDTKMQNHLSEVEIAGKKYVSTNILAILNASLFIEGNQRIESSEIKEIQKNYYYERIYKTTLMSFIFVLFFILIINFLFFSKYYNSTNSQANKNIQELTDRKDSLNAKISRQIDFIAANSIIMKNKLSIYSDRIATTISNDICLIELNINPVEINNENINFNKGILKINGTYLSNESISLWIEKINNLEWVKHTTVDFCKYDYEKRTNYFSITINYE